MLFVGGLCPEPCNERRASVGLDQLAPGRPVALRIERANGEIESIELRHSYSEEQLAWFRAGSALNFVREHEQPPAKC